MALSRQQSQIWQAMNVGVQWVLRDGDDPLAPQARPAQPAAQPSAGVAPTASAAPASPAASAAASPTPSAPAIARRGPMATRLRRQQAQAAGTPASAPSMAPAPMPSAAPAPDAVSRPAAAPMPSLKPVRAPARGPRPGVSVAATPERVSAQADPQLAADVRTASWQEIKAIVDRCTVCPMAKERTHTVVADGAPGCPIVMIGEAPGREEDLSGIPFVGNSGKLLTEILKACSLERGKDVAICNVLKCRPPGNRDPHPDEVAACAAFLDRQLELLQPKLLVLMGKHAVSRILGETKSISALRGKVFDAQIAGRTVPAVVTYHPSYLLRNPIAKELGWHDILFAKKNLPPA